MSYEMYKRDANNKSDWRLRLAAVEGLKDIDCVLQDLSTQYCKEKVHTFAPEIFL